MIRNRLNEVKFLENSERKLRYEEQCGYNVVKWDGTLALFSKSALLYHNSLHIVAFLMNFSIG